MNQLLIASQGHRDDVRDKCKRLIAALGELETYSPATRDEAIAVHKKIDTFARAISDLVLSKTASL